MTVENILLDCDPGLDDAAAIFLAAGSPRIHVLGITTVAGNQTIERVTKNAFFVAKMAGMGGCSYCQGLGTAASASAGTGLLRDSRRNWTGGSGSRA